MAATSSSSSSSGSGTIGTVIGAVSAAVAVHYRGGELADKLPDLDSPEAAAWALKVGINYLRKGPGSIWAKTAAEFFDLPEAIAGVPLNGDDGCYHPTSITDVEAIVRVIAANAAANVGVTDDAKKLKPYLTRARGAAHSFPHTITGVPISATYGTGKSWKDLVGPVVPDWLPFAKFGNNKGAITDYSGQTACLLFDKMIAVTWTDPTERDSKTTTSTTVTALAGCHVGVDPGTPGSTKENGFTYQIDQKGWALGDLGGIDHQTVAGFVSTGSSGGSLTDALHDRVVGVSLVTGTGELKELKRPVDASGNDTDFDNDFWAVGISMGLFGLIVSVTFKLRRRYAVKGTEQFFDVSKWTPAIQDVLPFDYKPFVALPEKTALWKRVVAGAGLGAASSAAAGAFADVAVDRDTTASDTKTRLLVGAATGTTVALLAARSDKEITDTLTAPPTKGSFCEWAKTRHTRLIWWPQNGVKKLTVWQAEEIEGEYDPTYSADYVGPDSNYKAYREAALWEQALFTVVIWAAEAWNECFVNGMPLPNILNSGLTFALNQLVVKTDKATGLSDVQKFQGGWKDIIPMDNQMSDKLLSTIFTELWIDVADADKAIQLLAQYFDGQHPQEDWYSKDQAAWKSTGVFSWELYTAKRSNFWLSPAYQKDVFRIDCFWLVTPSFSNTSEQPTQFYQQLWDLLDENKIAYRPHNGKYQPLKFKSAAEWREHRNRYPKFGAFLEKRKAYDPNDIFYSAYWRSVFTEPVEAPVAAAASITAAATPAVALVAEEKKTATPAPTPAPSSSSSSASTSSFTVKVGTARNLSNLDGDNGTKSDPYVLVQLLDEKDAVVSVQRTATAGNRLDVTWKTTFNFDEFVKANPGVVKAVRFRVMDEDTKTPDEHIGSATVFLRSKGEQVVAWASAQLTGGAFPKNGGTLTYSLTWNA